MYDPNLFQALHSHTHSTYCSGIRALHTHAATHTDLYNMRDTYYSTLSYSGYFLLCNPASRARCVKTRAAGMTTATSTVSDTKAGPRLRLNRCCAACER